MTYVTTYCQYEKYKAGNQFKDEQGNKRVCCFFYFQLFEIINIFI